MSILFGEGLAFKEGSSFSYQYNLTDHLGNVRNVTDASNVSVQSNDYYPFGLTHNAVANFAKNKYLYNGKEAQDETIGGTVFNLLDYGARLYDLVIGDWRNVDPLAEKSRRWSPYVYCFNSPMVYIDPDGMKVILAGDQVKATYKQLNSSTNLKVKINSDGVLTASGKVKTDADKLFLEAINNSDVVVQVNATSSNYTENGKWFVGGAFGGSKIGEDGKGSNSIT